MTYEEISYCKTYLKLSVTVSLMFVSLIQTNHLDSSDHLKRRLKNKKKTRKPSTSSFVLINGDLFFLLLFLLTAYWARRLVLF